MKSPITGLEMKLVFENRELKYRGEQFSYIAQLHLCEDSGEMFTTTHMDEINIGQVYNQYRVKYGIPFPDEIAETRSKYGLSASKMSEILGFGVNQYRLYENGEMPNEAIGKTLKNIESPIFFESYVNNARNQFSAKEFEKIISKVKHAYERKKEDDIKMLIFKSSARCATNGYAPLEYSRVKNIILYFIEKLGGVFTTKMNKLLFYTDFASYKQRGVAMSGLSYRAIQYGPIPMDYQIVYGLMDDVETEVVRYPSGVEGDMLCSEISADISIFSSKEISILDRVIQRFRECNASEISDISHYEDAWINHKATKEVIDFNTAFTLKAI